jgi:rfaE bifunctional protein kinase chain/domain
MSSALAKELVKEYGYQRKIKTREELRAILGPFPREKKVIMCHGTFDLVHPGHIRHLLFAKSKADVLVVSLTCDAWIQKSDFRPFVPQDLRAMNLAALEMVDYVLIDENPTPIQNILFVQPDYFAKGYDYRDGKIPPKTQEEIDTLKSYGADMLFTPGDVVFSSSKFIEKNKPNLLIEKLLTLMASESITFDTLRNALALFPKYKVHVIGDTIVDSYVFCTPISTGSSKTPTLSVRFDRQVDYSGGAAVVAKHLRASGAEVRFSTVLGNDEMKTFIVNDLTKCGVDCRPVIDATRCTTQKMAFIANSYRMLKFDRVDNQPISGKTLDDLLHSYSSSDADGFVFSDFRHGIFNRATIPDLTEKLPKGKIKVADSQVASRWGNILEFQGFDLITPNEREARFSLADQDSVVRPMALQLYKQANCKLLILKLGSRGSITYRHPSDDVRAFFNLDSFADNVVDPVGAGDALLAYATLALIAKQSDVVASILGNIAAGVACEHDGNWQVTPEEIGKKIDSLENRSNYK